MAYLSDREADTSKQNQVNKEERFNKGIGVIHPVMPSDSKEKQIQKEGGRAGHVQFTDCIRSAQAVAVSGGEHMPLSTTC